MGSQKMDKILQGVKQLPPMPQTVEKVMQLLSDQKSSTQEISKIISLDQSLAAQILRLCNSPYYGLSKEITSITQAIVLLGHATLRNLVTASFAHTIANKPLKGYMLQKGELWKHSIACAFGSEHIARSKAKSMKDTAFTAGLIHDIGKVVLDSYVDEEYDQIFQLTRERNMPFMLVEKEILGFDHAEIGAKIAEQWRLPAELVEVIRFHHQPELARHNEKLTAIVHITDALCMMMGAGVGGDGILYPLDEKAYSILGLDPSDEEEILLELTKKLEGMEAFSPAEPG